MAVRISQLAIFLSFFSHICITKSADQCISGSFHKNSPGPEGKGYVECHPWQNKTCCTAAFTKEFKANQTKQLYGHDWHRCKKLSKSCERFWMNQECFYQCSPYVYKWKVLPSNPVMDIVEGIPICASVCDRWYDACKNDLICVENVLEDYNFTEHGENLCPRNRPCVSYKSMYGSGKALCEKMWGKSYVYTKENFDSSNCMVMWFNGENPNKNVKYNSKTKSVGNQLEFSVYLLMLLLLLICSY